MGAGGERVTERKPAGVSFETWVERQVKDLADPPPLASSGRAPAARPLAFDPDETVYDWAVAKARREGITPAEMLPPGLALRRERDDLPARVAALPSEAAVLAAVDRPRARRGPRPGHGQRSAAPSRAPPRACERSGGRWSSCRGPPRAREGWGRRLLSQNAASSTSMSALSVCSTMTRSADSRGSTWVVKKRAAASLPS